MKIRRNSLIGWATNQATRLSTTGTKLQWKIERRAYHNAFPSRALQNIYPVHNWVLWKSETPKEFRIILTGLQPH